MQLWWQTIFYYRIRDKHVPIVFKDYVFPCKERSTAIKPYKVPAEWGKERMASFLL